MKKLLLFILFVPLVSFGQTKVELALCLSMQARSFASESSAVNALNKILSITNNYNQNFVMIPCSEISNAAAIKYNGTRYILYDKAFMRKISSYTNDWSNLFILAHEVGHHYYDHTQDISNSSFNRISLEAQRNQELEADAFAGAILYQLGASLSQALEITNIFPEGDDSYNIHPNRSKRRDAVNSGYYNRSITSISNGISAENFFQKGLYENDPNRAIALYSKAIEKNPKYIDAYAARARSKQKLNNYSGAINDFSIALNIDSNAPEIYNQRANAYFKNNNFYEAMSDAESALELQPNIDGLYFLKSNIKISQYNDISGGCIDLEKAIYLIKSKKDYFTSLGVNQSQMLTMYENLKNSFADVYRSCRNANVPYEFEREIDNFIRNSYTANSTSGPYHESAFTENRQSSYSVNSSSSMTADEYYDRGIERINETEDYNGAISDFTKYLEVESEGTYYAYSAYRRRGIAKNYLKDYKGAIADFTKAIELNPDYDDAYSSRGISKENIDDLNGACADWRKAASLGNSVSAEWVRDQCGGGNSTVNNDYVEENTSMTADEYYERGVERNFETKDYSGAISDFTKYLGMDGNSEYSNDLAYRNRGVAKENSGDLNGACDDWREAARLGSEDSAEWVRDQCGGGNSDTNANSSYDQITIFGYVSNQKGERLPGATVTEAGTNNGVSTDFNGNYSITVKKGSNLSYSFVKCKTYSTERFEDEEINISLACRRF